MSYLKLQASKIKEITPSDTEDIQFENQQNRGCVLYIGTGGDVSVITASGSSAVFKNMSDGSFLPVQVLRLLEDTTASDIVALW
jgi:hypothetical protein